MLPTIRKTGSYGVPLEAKATIQALQSELLKSRPRMHKVLKLRGAGFSKRETAKMLGFGETTIRKEMAIIEKCGYHVGPVGTQLDLFGGE
jgi:transposase